MAENATTAYVDSVRNRSFPAAKHTFDMNEEEKNLFFDLVDNRFGLASPALLRAQHPRTSDSSENLFDLDLTPPRKIDTVTVVGAGSLGMLIAARLASAGLSRVHLVDLPSNTTLDVINRRGSIRVTEPLTGTEQTATHFPSGRVQAFGSADEALTAGGLADLVVVAVKSCDTAEGAKVRVPTSLCDARVSVLYLPCVSASFKCRVSYPRAFVVHINHQIAAQLCHGEGTVLSVQNGDNLKTLSDAVGPARLVVGSTTLAANKVGLAAGTVANANPRGHTTLAAVHGNGQARAEALATLINATNCGLGSCTVEGSGPESAANVLWQKLAINAVINPLTALLEVENGRLVGLPAARPLMHSLATEFMAVANAKGLALSWNPDSLLLAAEDVAKATSENKSSMLVDVLRGSPSEIAAITGKVVDEAARLGVLAPTHGALLALVRAKEELRRQARPVAGELEILTTVEDVRQFRQRHAHCTIGMIPTMGGLHAGHMSLVDAALQDCDLAIASIFVNPKQFAPTEDLDVYPRQTQVDLETLRSAGVAAVFLPTAETMYPGTFATAVDIDGIDTVSEGAARPGFFRGVATVCTKLFNIVQPDKVFFGQKDGLQCVVIRRIVQDLNIPTEVVVCPTSREQSGLALSTRNQYLTEKQHKAAPVLYKALLAGSDSFMRGNANDSDTVIAAARAVLEDEPMVETIE
jgi:pantoate--beta-alanine ligase